jgi:hypothetical protein
VNTLGCGGIRADQPIAILTDFQKDNAAAINTLT